MRSLEKNNCVFISTSFDGDIGIVSEKMGYISAYSKKPSVIVGAILKAYGRYDVSEIIKGSIKNEVDVIENADIVGSMEFYEQIQNIDVIYLTDQFSQFLLIAEIVAEYNNGKRQHF